MGPPLHVMRPLTRPLIVFVPICLVVGWASGLVTETSVADWYPTLAKPPWTPPNLAFPIAWTILYILMGVAAALAWSAAGPGRRQQPMTAFFIQLALNVLWTLLFFGLKNPLYGLIDILLLMAAIVATMLAFRRVSRIAVLLLLPYLLWVAFATTLNFEIWRLN